MRSLAIALVLQVGTALAEPPLAPDAVYAEAGGPALAYSFDYERLVDAFALRAGVGFTSLGGICGYRDACAFIAGAPNASTSPSANLWLAPLTVSYLGIRAGRHVLEIGGGATLAYAQHVGPRDAPTSGGAFGSTFVGYRYHPLGSIGFQFRAGAALLAGNGMEFAITGDRPGSFGVLPTGYLSLGFAF